MIFSTPFQPSAKAKDKEDAKALGVNRVPENQKREVYERVRRAVDAKPGICTNHKVGVACAVCFWFCVGACVGCDAVPQQSLRPLAPLANRSTLHPFCRMLAAISNVFS